MRIIGLIAFTPAENEFARELQRAMGIPDIGINSAIESLDLDAVKAQFREDTSGFSYRAYVPEGPPPIPQTD